MVVKPDRGDVKTAIQSAASYSTRSVSALGLLTTDVQIESLLQEISQDTIALNQKLLAAMHLLSEKGAWCEAVRLLVGVGGYQLSEIAEALGVMRSTVTRWYNGETTPSRSQTSIYFDRLIDYMEPTRPFTLQVRPEDLVRT